MMVMLCLSKECTLLDLAPIFLPRELCPSCSLVGTLAAVHMEQYDVLEKIGSDNRAWVCRMTAVFQWHAR